MITSTPKTIVGHWDDPEQRYGATPRSLALAPLVAFLFLAMLDVIVRAWHPHPVRLPEHFSEPYLNRVIDNHGTHRPVLILGDSVVWGYGIPAKQSLAMQLEKVGLSKSSLNLSFEGGSPVNEYIMLRTALTHGVRPRLVILNLNQKEFNPFDRSYRTVLPQIEQSARRVLDDKELNELQHPGIHPKTPAGTLDAFISSAWCFYAMRTDIRQALFGDIDLASTLETFVRDHTGMAARKAAAQPRGAQRYLTTYDITPLATDNISLRYYRKTLALLKTKRIPALIFATPTNHKLLGPALDDPQYHQNITTTLQDARRIGLRALDLDQAIPTREFIDNDHMTANGNARLAQFLRSAV